MLARLSSSEYIDEKIKNYWLKLMSDQQGSSVLKPLNTILKWARRNVVKFLMLLFMVCAIE